MAHPSAGLKKTGDMAVLSPTPSISIIRSALLAVLAVTRAQTIAMTYMAFPGNIVGVAAYKPLPYKLATITKNNIKNI